MTFINVAGEIVGIAFNGGGEELRAFVYRNGSIDDLGTLGGRYSKAYAINDSGDIVGGSTYPGDSADHAFLYRNGSFHDLGTLPGTSFSVALAVNGSGHAVGYAFSPALGDLAFLYANGTLINLSALMEVQEAGWQALTEARGINDQGQIVGTGINRLGLRHAFLLTPVPEPLTGLFMLVGLGGVAGLVGWRGTISRPRSPQST